MYSVLWGFAVTLPPPGGFGKNYNNEARCDYQYLPFCPDTLMGTPLQNAPFPFRAVYILSSMQL